MSINIKDILIPKNVLYDNNIHHLSDDIKNTISQKVSDFYEEIPFPNYTDDDNKLSILNRGNANTFYKKLKSHIGLNKKILEIGSGTSQLSMYLATGTNNDVVALDLTKKSLKVASKFAKENNIKNIKFLNADLHNDIFLPEIFDFVLSLGVLHHTKDTYQGFVKTIKPLKKNGYVFIGLYNKYGRKRLELRRFFSKIFGRKIIFLLDPMIRFLNQNPKRNKDKIKAWINDQYFHPVESSYTVDNVLEWFNKNNIEFISSIPSMDLEKISMEKIFSKNNLTGKLFRIIIQILMNFQGHGRKSGLFTMIGKKCK